MMELEGCWRVYGGIGGLLEGLGWNWRVVGGFMVELEGCWRVYGGIGRLLEGLWWNWFIGFGLGFR